MENQLPINAEELLDKVYFLQVVDKKHGQVIQADKDQWKHVRSHFEECKHGPNCCKPRYILAPNKYYHPKNCTNQNCPSCRKPASEALHTFSRPVVNDENEDWQNRYTALKREEFVRTV